VDNSTFWLMFWLVMAIYLIPSMFAWGKKGQNGIIALNILLGWTFLGWVGALCWALAAEKVEKKKGEKE